MHAQIRNSSASGNNGIGIFVEAPSGSALLDVESCLITNNNFGIGANGSGAIASISNCTITQNSVNGFFIGGGAILTRGNNTISQQNSSDTLTPIAAQ